MVVWKGPIQSKIELFTIGRKLGVSGVVRHILSDLDQNEIHLATMGGKSGIGG